MNTYFIQITGWLMANRENCINTLPSGVPMYRIVNCDTSNYYTGYVSTAGGTCKPVGADGNYYTLDWNTAFAEARPSGRCVFEIWTMTREQPIFDARRLPQDLWQPIYNDRDLPAPEKFQKSWNLWSGLSLYESGVRDLQIEFSSRRGTGIVIMQNPHTTPMKLVFTGAALPFTGQQSYDYTERMTTGNRTDTFPPDNESIAHSGGRADDLSFACRNVSGNCQSKNCRLDSRPN